MICASNPLPQEAASSTASPDAAKASPVPAVAATEVPLQKALDNEKIPEPQALPSKKEEAAPQKNEEKKREAPPAPIAAAVTPAPENASPKPAEQPKVDAQQPVAQPISQPEQQQNAGKSLPQQDAAAESTPKPAENVSPAAADSPKAPSEPAPTPVAAAAASEVKNADAKQAVESTVVPVVPAAIASEKKINAGL